MRTPGASHAPPRLKSARLGPRRGGVLLPTAGDFLRLALVILSASRVCAVEDGALEPVSTVKWMYGVCGVFFVFVVMPLVYLAGEGVDPSLRLLCAGRLLAVGH